MKSSPAGVSRPLLVAVLPALLATVIGVVALWPRAEDPIPPRLVRPPGQLVNGTVTTDRIVPCQGGLPPELATTCRVATVRLTSGPDRGGDTTLELAEGVGQVRLRVGDRVVLGRTSDRERASGTTSPTSSGGRL